MPNERWKRIQVVWKNEEQAAVKVSRGGENSLFCVVCVVMQPRSSSRPAPAVAKEQASLFSSNNAGDVRGHAPAKLHASRVLARLRPILTCRWSMCRMYHLLQPMIELAQT